MDAITDWLFLQAFYVFSSSLPKHMEATDRWSRGKKATWVVALEDWKGGYCF